VWSPDGNKVAISLMADEERLMEVLTASGRPLFSVRGAVPQSWSPRSDRLAYTTGPVNATDLNATIGVVDLAGKSVAIGSGLDPSWAPDGTRLLFARVIRTNDMFVPPSLQFDVQVWTANAAGGDEQVLFARGGGAARWSFDGRFLALVRSSARGSRERVLSIVRADGS
jgi:Tol biopolymer transport system component